MTCATAPAAGHRCIDGQHQSYVAVIDHGKRTLSSMGEPHVVGRVVTPIELMPRPVGA